ncbi:Uncharacterised protein [Mycobacterium tuberculosis]|uniref:Uncharacterized protein n=1 Tax=Mycobacterium tuberculosis TaxID=1773 RepID=A0A655IZ34_MYCTX|nr:Uncharacterised protein [Mycobacterium tuberculosis]COW28946.1 Uncharacterised protein [Mycobacterium tuberculosis]COX07895.1 Uncharacterised protein [Mycobacterium tuberculosis]
MLGANPLGVAVRDRREQQELVGRHLEALLADPALTQQHRLPAVQQRVHRRAPLLQRWRHHDPASRTDVRMTPAPQGSEGTPIISETFCPGQFHWSC